MIPRLFIGGELHGMQVPMEKKQGTYSNPTVDGYFEYYHRMTLNVGGGITEIVYVESETPSSHVSTLFRECRGI